MQINYYTTNPLFYEQHKYDLLHSIEHKIH